jgi:hypothetical protein
MPLPAPRTWTDGEEPENIPTADDLNLDWRDSFEFLLGTTRPMIYLTHSTVQAITNTASAIAMQNELLKRGGMTHAANSATVEVPYDGMYQGFFLASFATYSTLSTRSIAYMDINGVATARADISPQIVGDAQLHGSFSLNLNAGDDVRLFQRNTNGTVNTNVSATSRTKWAMWYAGDRTF